MGTGDLPGCQVALIGRTKFSKLVDPPDAKKNMQPQHVLFVGL